MGWGAFMPDTGRGVPMDFATVISTFGGQGAVAAGAVAAFLYLRSQEKEMKSELRAEIERLKKERDELMATNRNLDRQIDDLRREMWKRDHDS